MIRDILESRWCVLPVVVLAFALAITGLARNAATGPHRTASRAVLVQVMVEVVTTSAVGLSTRHTIPEDRVNNASVTFRSRSLDLRP